MVRGGVDGGRVSEEAAVRRENASQSVRVAIADVGVRAVVRRKRLDRNSSGQRGRAAGQSARRLQLRCSDAFEGSHSL